MIIRYFKVCGFLDFSHHPYDIGNPISFWQKYNDNHFLNKIYDLDDQYWSEYYSYHLTYTLGNNIGKEEDFFRQVWQIVDNRIKYLQIQDPFSTYHDRYLFRIGKLQLFQEYLSGIDKWNVRPSDLLIAEKNEIIYSQKSEIAKLQTKLAELNEYEVVQKIWIAEGSLPTIIDLVQQIRELELPSGRALLKSDHKSPYSKMISKYFSHAGRDIPVETARNYFVEKKGEVPTKGTSIQSEHRIFKIIPVKEIRK